MSRSRSSCTARVLLVAALMSAIAAPAYGGDWPWPLGSSVSLRFGDAWTGTDGVECTHRGIDIAAGAGAEVRACTDGTVAFCGPVPSSAGGRVIAVTVRTDEGLKVTYMPLEGASVAAGARVRTGDGVGTLAPAGDGSSAGAHLHLSVKRGDLAMDPEPLLAAQGSAPVAAGGASAVSAAPVSEDVAHVVPSPASPSAAAAASGAEPVPVATPVGEPLPDAPVSTAPIPAGAGADRAIHSLPAPAGLRVPVVSLSAPAISRPALALCLRLGAGVASVLALWALAGRRSMPSPVLADGRRR